MMDARNFMPSLWVIFLLCCCGGGCISTSYQGSTYPESAQITLASDPDMLPPSCTIMGHGTAWGEAEDCSNAKLQEKILTMGRDRGANYCVILGTVLLPDGYQVNDLENDDLEALDFDQYHTEMSISQDIGDPGETNREIRFIRKIYAVFYHCE